MKMLNIKKLWVSTAVTFPGFRMDLNDYTIERDMTPNYMLIIMIYSQGTWGDGINPHVKR